MAEPVARNEGKIMSSIADAFEELAPQLKAPVPRLEVGKFAQACSLVAPLLQHFGIGVKYANIEFSSKVGVIIQAAKSVNTIEELVDRDIQQNTTKFNRSNSRCLIRVKRSLEFFSTILEQIWAIRGNSLRIPVGIAYEEVFGPYHGWAIRKAASAAIYTVPTKAKLWKRLNVDDTSAEVQMQRIATALAPVIEYIDKIFHSSESGEEVLGLI